LLADDGVMLMETSYCLDVVQHDLIDTIFHEHLSYFAVAPLAIFFKSLGMELIDAEAIPTKGGSIRVTAQLASGPRKTSPAVAEFITREKAAGLDRPEAYAAMHGRLDRLRHELHDLLAPLKSSGRKISAYGAAVGLTTMIYQFGLGPYLSCIFDDNRGKFGLYSPGLHLPCLDSSEIYRLKPDVIIVLAWRYATTIVEMHHQFLREGGTFVIPLSEVRVVSEGSPLPKRP